jgi:lysophospholipase
LRHSSLVLAAAEPVAPAQRLRSLPFNPQPAPARVRLLRSVRGVDLRAAFWPAPQGRVRGTVLLLQGRGDLIEKYFEPVGELLDRGFSVATCDWRGQGGSGRELDDPLKSHVDDFDLYQADLECLAASVPDGPAWRGPRLALAHSMGAAVLLQAQAARRLVDAAVLTAPMIALAPSIAPPLAAPLSAALRRVGLGRAYVPRAQAGRRRQIEAFLSNVLTSDRARYDRIVALVNACPELALAEPTIGWVDAAFTAMGRFQRRAFAARIGIPVLTVAGSADRVTHTPAAEALMRRLPQGSMLTLPECRHEVLFERDAIRTRFWSAFDHFVEAALAPRQDYAPALR